MKNNKKELDINLAGMSIEDIDNMVTEESLTEAKADIDAFINKFGEDTYNNFLKAKDRLKNKGQSVDLTWYVKNMEKKDLDELILSLYDKDTDKQKKRIIQGTDKEIRGKYNYLGEKDGYKVYQPLDVQSSMDLGVNTGWCTTGRYGHYGHPEFTPSLKDAKEHWDDYTEQGIKFYYFLDPKTMYGEYALALYPKVLNGRTEIDNGYIQETNIEIYNAKDNLDYSVVNELPLDLIDEKIVLDITTFGEQGLLVNDDCVIKCKKDVVNIIIPDNVTIINPGAFLRCSYLTSITIPDSVTSIGESAFYHCSSLKSITIPDSVTSIKWNTFSDCFSLQSITIPDSVTSIGDNAFSGCSSLTSITIPNSVTSIGSYAFYDCSSLESITIPNSVTSIGREAFRDCPKVTVYTNNEYIINYCKEKDINCKPITNESLQEDKYTSQEVLNIKEELGLQDRLNKLGYSKPNNKKDTKTFDTVDSRIKDTLEDSLNEAPEKHDTLNPKLFNEDNAIKEEVRDKLLEIANYFMDKAKEDGVEFDVKDILIVGSNANYNYTKDSDVDLHIVVSKKPDCNKEHLELIYQAYKSMFNNKFDCTIYGIPVEIYVEFEDEDVIEQPSEETNIEEAVITPTTPYMLRDDGRLLTCGTFHPYIKTSYKQSLSSVQDELAKNPQRVKWFKEHSKLDETKALCDKCLSGEITEDEMNRLNDLTNQEFCRVRTSNFKIKSGGDNGEIYFRISSKGFNWFDLIWKVVMDNKKDIKNVTVVKDTQSLGGKEFNYYVVDGKPLSHIDTEEFLTLKGNPMIESEE